MRFLELRDFLVSCGCTRKRATLAIRLAHGLENSGSLVHNWTEGDGHMSQKSTRKEFEAIEDSAKFVTWIEAV